MQRQREEAQAAQKRLEEFRDVLEVVKNTLGNGAGALARKRGENANLTAQIEEKRVALETARRRYQASQGCALDSHRPWLIGTGGAWVGWVNFRRV